MTIYYEGQLAGRSGTLGADETLSYLFRSDNRRDGSPVVARHRKCPRIGGQHPDYDFLYIKNGGLTIAQGSGSEWNKWTVTAKFEKLDEDEEKPEPTKDVTKQESQVPDFDPHISLTFEDYSTPLLVSNAYELIGSEIDLKKNALKKPKKTPCVASNLEPYDPPPEVFRQNATLVVRRNFRLTARKKFKDVTALRNTVNNGPFTVRLGGKQGVSLIDVELLQSRLKVAIGEVQKYKSRTGKTIPYAEIECQFCIKEEGWMTSILDYGTYHLDPVPATSLQARIRDSDFVFPASTDKIPFKDAEQNRTIGMLNGYGGELSDASAVTYNDYLGYPIGDHSKLYTNLTR